MFSADPGPEPGAEAYLCQVVDIEGLDGASQVWVRGVAVEMPSGPVSLHHASLFAAKGSPPTGPTSCDPMPERVAALGVFTPGAVPLLFPEDTAISFPLGTHRLAVLTHVFRSAEGPPSQIRVSLLLAEKKPPHAANWVDVFAPTPVLFPHRTETSVGRCTFLSEAHILTTWPHMHRRGLRFSGTIVRSSGEREPLISVDPWDFNHQPIYPASASLAPGDAVETSCTWSNPSEDTVLPGPFTADEMCNQGLFVFPFEAARCAE